jgi:hypothetical protein
MSSLAAGLFSMLSTAATLTPLQATRIYPVVLPEIPTLPATTFEDVGGRSEPTFDHLGPQRVRMQLNFHATTYMAAEQLAHATRLVLDKFVGAAPNGFYFTNIQFLKRIGNFDSDPKQFRCSNEYYVSYNL